MENPKHRSAAELPQEILSEIFVRLSSKSVGKSRCVSKPWNLYLTSNQFIKTHLARITPFQPVPEKLLLLGPRSLFSVTAIDDANELDGVTLEFDNEDMIKIGGSCDGLVLIVGDKNRKFLINPTTEKTQRLPNSPLALSPYSSYCMHGFGYDSSTDDYKVVTLSYFDPENCNTRNNNDTFIDVYSLKSNSWRRKGISPYHHHSKTFREATASGVLLKGALHWVGWKSSSSFIAAFDLSSEKFKKISRPKSINKETLKCSKLMVIRGRLAIVDDLSNEDVILFSYDSLNVFIMNVYGLPDSWTKMVVKVEKADWKKALCFWRGVLLLSVHDDNPYEQYVVGYSFEHQDWAYLEIGCDEGQFDDGWTFSESLVPPHFNTFH